MKLITKNNEVVEGEPISEAMAQLIDDINAGSLGPVGLLLYSHQKREFIGYMLENYELTLKTKPVDISNDAAQVPEVEPFVYLPPAAVATSEDDDKPF